MNKMNWPLIVGILLPIVFIIVLALVVYLPTLSIKPSHDFVYSDESPERYYGEQYRNTFDIENGALVAVPLTLAEDMVVRGDFPTLYRYDMETGTSREISRVDAGALTLDAGPASPDGYAVSYSMNYTGGFLSVGGGDASGYYVTKGGSGKRLHGITSRGSGYGEDITFVGWIVE